MPEDNTIPFEKEEDTFTNELGNNSFSSQWLEAQGKLDNTDNSTHTHPFISKHKSQATYLTQLGGAVMVNLDGSWNYLLKKETLSFDETGVINDGVVIESSDGLAHELKFDIERTNATVLVSRVHYINPNSDNALLSESDAVDDLEVKGPISQAENEMTEDKGVLSEEQEEDNADDTLEDEQRDAYTQEDEFIKDEVVEEIVNEETSKVEVSTEEENRLKDEQEKTDKLLKVQALMNQRQEEKTVKLKQERIEQDILEEETKDEVVEDGFKEEVLEDTIPLEKNDEDEVHNKNLLKVQALMNKRQDEAVLKAEEDAAYEVEEEPEQTQAYTGDDEMLLKVQALMNAKKNIDTNDIEFTGGDGPSIKEEIEEEIAEEVSENEQVEEIDEDECSDVACLKESIVLNEADGSEVFTIASYLEGFTLNEDGSFIFKPHDVTYEYLAENETQSYHVEVEVTRAGRLRLSGSVELFITGPGTKADLSFTQGLFTKKEVSEADDYMEVSVDELAEYTEDLTDSYTQDEEDNHGHLAVVFDSIEEGAHLHSDGTIGITVMLPTGAQSGEVIIINSSEFSITQAEAEAGQLLYSVYPDDEIEVSFRDSDNNISDSVRAKANQKNVEMIEFLVAAKVIGEVGAQSMHASIGEPAQAELLWGIRNTNAEVGNYIQSELGSVHIDGETGELEYKYRENSGLDKYGTSADNKLNENFILCLGNADYAELEVSLHIQAQSIHGYSGHQIDSSTIEEIKLLKIDHSKVKPKAKDNTEMIQMLESGLQSNKAKISKVMLEIYEAKSTGLDTNEAKQKLQALTDQKTHLEDKINSFK